MKQIFTLLALFLVLSCHSQVVDGVDIWKDSTVQFIQVVGTNTGIFTKKIIINVDYGQKVSWGTDSRVEDGNGKLMKFNSMMDALNFFYRNGWDFVNAYALSVGNDNVYHYLLERNKN